MNRHVFLSTVLALSAQHVAALALLETHVRGQDGSTEEKTWTNDFGETQMMLTSDVRGSLAAVSMAYGRGTATVDLTSAPGLYSYSMGTSVFNDGLSFSGPLSAPYRGEIRFELTVTSTQGDGAAPTPDVFLVGFMPGSASGVQAMAYASAPDADMAGTTQYLVSHVCDPSFIRPSDACTVGTTLSATFAIPFTISDTSREVGLIWGLNAWSLNHAMLDARMHVTSITVPAGVTVTSGALGAVTPVPEPQTWLLLAMGAAAIGLQSRRSRFPGH